MKYQFGVMSSKYELESKDEFLAKVSMCLFMKTSAPIVIYSPITTAFKPTEVLEEHKEYCENNKEELIKVFQSIKECVSPCSNEKENKNA